MLQETCQFGTQLPTADLRRCGISSSETAQWEVISSTPELSTWPILWSQQWRRNTSTLWNFSWLLDVITRCCLIGCWRHQKTVGGNPTLTSFIGWGVISVNQSAWHILADWPFGEALVAILCTKARHCLYLCRCWGMSPWRIWTSTLCVPHFTPRSTRQTPKCSETKMAILALTNEGPFWVVSWAEPLEKAISVEQMEFC